MKRMKTLGLENFFPYHIKNLKVYALVGPSGTGKSYRAQAVALDRDIECIIDDGLLIRGNSVIAGKSAKKASTKIQTIRDALFSSKEEQENIRRALRKNRVKSLLILRYI